MTRELGKPRHIPSPDIIDTQLLDVHELLPTLARRYHTLHSALWASRSSSDVVIAISGHGDPTGDTVAASQHMRDQLAAAGRLILDLCATARGINTTLHQAAGTSGNDGTQAAADMSMGDSMRGRCNNCQQHAATRKGLCQPCNMWARRHGTPRPADQWQQQHHG